MQTQTTSSNARQALPLLPPVDISEDPSAITIIADMPGVEKNALSINVDGRTLTVEAPLSLGEDNALVSIYAEIKASNYRRVFELSGELDTTSIDAGFVDGVLTLRIPKLERAKPRRIDVKTS
jgi:HSP20 family molecular chaperone IbpA